MKLEKRKQAINLRISGYSIKEIASKLDVSKGSVSNWVRDIKLSDEQKSRLHDKMALNAVNGNKAWVSKAVERRKIARQKGFNLAKSDIDFRVICALYWGEGRKTKNFTSISNSDKNLLSVFSKWLITNGYQFNLYIHYFVENGILSEDVVEWWSDLNANKFKPYSITIKRESQKKNIGKLLYGTATIVVLKSTDLFFQIMGGIDYLMGG